MILVSVTVIISPIIFFFFLPPLELNHVGLIMLLKKLKKIILELNHVRLII